VYAVWPMPSDTFNTATRIRPDKGKAGPVFAGEVAFEQVAYSIRGKPILSSINAVLEAGKVACLLGPSGCGKTTLLRLAAGIMRPSSGRILLDGLVLSGPQSFVPPEKRNIGLVFQDFALFPHMTALENVAYGLYALERSEALRVAAITLERVGLGQAKDRYPTSFSGGEQQRVALARALVPRPQVILLDEPFSGLDQRLKDSVRDETLALLRETRATALLVTHDPEEALAFADRIHVMQAGHIAQSGMPEELIHKPVSAAVARFFKNYNTFRGIVKASHVETPLGRVATPGHAEGSAVDVLVAPAALRIESGEANATIIENRDVGAMRRIVAKLHANDQTILLQGADRAVGPVKLVLSGQATHIFAASDNVVM
jgi:iron(III) transport system ATP-binding protein